MISNQSITAMQAVPLTAMFRHIIHASCDCVGSCASGRFTFTYLMTKGFFAAPPIDLPQPFTNGVQLGLQAVRSPLLSRSSPSFRHVYVSSVFPHYELLIDVVKNKMVQKSKNPTPLWPNTHAHHRYPMSPHVPLQPVLQPLCDAPRLHRAQANSFPVHVVSARQHE
jgi:hypothetical protein